MFRKAELIGSLTRNGFQKPSSRNVKFVLLVDDKAVGVRTVMSHSGCELGKSLLHQMKKELRFESQRDFEDFINCTYTYERYIENLKNRGIIR